MITPEDWAKFVWYVMQTDKDHETFLDGNKVVDVLWIAEEIVTEATGEPITLRYSFKESLHDGVTTERLYTSITVGKRKEIDKDV